jgi:hypothetical protein
MTDSKHYQDKLKEYENRYGLKQIELAGPNEQTKPQVLSEIVRKQEVENQKRYHFSYGVVEVGGKTVFLGVDVSKEAFHKR